MQTITTSSDDHTVPEVQAITLFNDDVALQPTGGSVVLTYGLVIADPISYDANSAEIREALEGIDGIESVRVTLSNSSGLSPSGGGVSSGTTWLVTFLDPVGNIDELAVDSHTLAPSGSTGVSVDTIADGTEAVGGTFLLQFGAAEGTTSSNLESDSTAAEVQAALNGLSTIGESGVVV